MVIVKVDLPSHLDDQFKAKVIDKYGLRRGAITAALLDAIKLWIDQKDDNDKKISKENEFTVPDDLRDKYLAMVNHVIVISANTLDELWDKLPVDPVEQYEIYTPNMPEKRRAQLGWSGSFKRR